MDIMNMVTGAMTPAIAGKIAGALGVPEGIVRKVMTLGVPVILASLMRRGSTAGGMDAIGAALGGLGKDPLASLGKTLGGDASQISAAAQGGSDILGSLLGVGSAGTLAKTLAGYAGVDEKSVGPMLGLAGSAALGGLKSAADDQKLDTAGVMRLLATQKDQITSAIPSDFARLLDHAGLLPQAPAARPAAPAPSVAESSGGMMKWILGLVALAVLAWLASQLFGSKTETTPAKTEEPATATAPAATDAVNPLLVEGVNIGDSLQSILTNLTGTLAGVKDATTAQAAVQALTEQDTALNGLQGAISGLTGDGKTALQSILGAALPTLKTTIDGLLADASIGPILKPVLDGILARLTSYGG
jgi:hypothetical protein